MGQTIRTSCYRSCERVGKMCWEIDSEKGKFFLVREGRLTRGSDRRFDRVERGKKERAR